MQENTKWYQDQKKQQQVIIIPTHTIVYPCIDVVAVKYVHDITGIVCNKIQANKDLQRHHTCLTNSDKNYIIEEI